MARAAASLAFLGWVLLSIRLPTSPEMAWFANLGLAPRLLAGAHVIAAAGVLVGAVVLVAGEGRRPGGPPYGAALTFGAALIMLPNLLVADPSRPSGGLRVAAAACLITAALLCAARIVWPPAAAFARDRSHGAFAFSGIVIGAVGAAAIAAPDVADRGLISFGGERLGGAPLHAASWLSLLTGIAVLGFAGWLRDRRVGAVMALGSLVAWSTFAFVDGAATGYPLLAVELGTLWRELAVILLGCWIFLLAVRGTADAARRATPALAAATIALVLGLGGFHLAGRLEARAVAPAFRALEGNRALLSTLHRIHEIRDSVATSAVGTGPLEQDPARALGFAHDSNSGLASLSPGDFMFPFRGPQEALALTVASRIRSLAVREDRVIHDVGRLRGYDLDARAPSPDAVDEGAAARDLRDAVRSSAVLTGTMERLILSMRPGLSFDFEAGARRGTVTGATTLLFMLAIVATFAGLISVRAGAGPREGARPEETD